jgi:tight adherence protein B
MNIIIVGIVLFVTLVFVIEMSIYAYNIIGNPDRGKTRKRLRLLSLSRYHDEIPDIVKKRLLSEIPLFNRLLYHVPGVRPFERLIRQADSQYPPGFFILLMVILAQVGFLASAIMIKTTTIALMAGFLSGILPLMYLRYKKKRRMDKFTVQLPDALDLIARSMKAGQAFTMGIGIVAEEFDDPLGTEFHETLEEVNFGMSVENAMRSLADRVDAPDLKYFAVSVILQRETGGNLAEIIESIAYLIRERFKLRGKIRSLSAEGRLSGLILVALPFAIAVAFRFVRPDYIETLFIEPAGKIMLTISAVMMAIGILLIRKIVNIKI